MKRRAPVLLGLILAIVAVVAAPAGAVTFGADLNALTATSQATCRQVYMPGVGYLPNVYGSSTPSCSAYNIGPTPSGYSLSTAGSTVLPMTPAQTGTITQVRIKTGAMNGVQSAAARLDVLATSSHVGGGDVACCIGTATTQNITLRPNTTVTVATNLPVATPLSPDATMYTGQILALTMLDPTVPLPAAVIPFNGFNGSFYGNMVFPGVAAGQERFNPNEQVSLVNTELLMSADVTITSSGGGGTPTPAPTPTPTPTAPGPAALTPGTLKVKGGKAAIGASCLNTYTQCPVVVRLQDRKMTTLAPVKASSGKVKGPTTFGTGTGIVATNAKGSITVRLTAAGVKRLKEKKSLRVWANVGMTATGKATSNLRVTLTR